MITRAEQCIPIQNMGVWDRVARFVIGGGVLGAVVFYYEMKHPALADALLFSLVALSLYPVLTSIFGWDPFYALFRIRTGSDRGRNQCGSFPYQIEALLGRAPGYCDTDVERSLEACHVEPAERPLHKVWVVDPEPMIYPDDATLDEYIMRHLPKVGGSPEKPPTAPQRPMDRAA